MKKILNLLSAIIIFCIFAVSVFAVTSQITNFTGQNNPFNITFAANENKSYVIAIPQYVYTNNVSLKITGFNNTIDSICYQEFANVSSSCGTLNTGGYYFNSSNSAFADAVDGNTSTYADGLGCGNHNLSINYTWPYNAVNAIWRITTADSSYNYTIPDTCRGSNLQLRVIQSDGGCNSLVGYCLNYSTGSWKDLTGNIFRWIADEGVFWSMNSYPNNLYISLDGQIQYNYSSRFNTSDTPSLNISKINSVLSQSRQINLTFHSDTAAILQVNLTNATYSFGIDNCSNSFGIPSNATTLNVSILDINNNPLDIFFQSTTAYDNTTYSRQHNNINNVSYCIYPNWLNILTYTQFLYNDSTNQYSYFLLTNFTNVTQKLNLYTQTGTTQVLFTVSDIDDNRLYLYTIHILKYSVGSGTYTTTEILQTDSNGHAIGNIVLNDAYYNLLVYDQNNNLVKTESAVRFTATTYNIVVTGATDSYFTELGDTAGLDYTITFNNATDNFVFTWADSSGRMNYACLKVTNSTYLGTQLMSDSCTLSTSGTIIYNINPQNDTTYVGQAYLKYNNAVFPLSTATYTTPANNLLFQVDLMGGLFVFAMLLMVGILIGLPNPILSMLYFALVTVVAWKLGFIAISLGMCSSLVILVIIMIYIGNRQQ